MSCSCYPANETCPSSARCKKKRHDPFLCRFGLHRKYVAQRNFGVDPDTPTLVIKLCRRHCGWADVKPNYKPPLD